MSELAPIAKADPELIRQMNTTEASNKHVAAVVRLQPDDPSEIVPSPERTEKLAKKILRRVGKRVGSSESRYNVFKNLGSFVVSAEPEFLRELISQPEVAAVVANQQPMGAVIEPVEKAGTKTRPAKVSRSAKGPKARSSTARVASSKSPR